MYGILGTALILRNYCSTPDHPKEAVYRTFSQFPVILGNPNIN